ncbi:hypothetical protein T484DRAFT_1798469 [Baffinella frigidus]|nr:hypothetical protein T484DRAFT_1798469 [Cryptophyta sp. CCMP2293]
MSKVDVLSPLAWQVKHMAGPFFSEGSYTKNSRAEIEALLAQLECAAGLT